MGRLVFTSMTINRLWTKSTFHFGGIIKKMLTPNRSDSHSLQSSHAKRKITLLMNCFYLQCRTTDNRYTLIRATLIIAFKKKMWLFTHTPRIDLDENASSHAVSFSLSADKFFFFASHRAQTSPTPMKKTT